MQAPGLSRVSFVQFKKEIGMDLWQIILVVVAILVGAAYFWRRSNRLRKG